MSKRWTLDVTINYPDREETGTYTYDTSERLALALGLLFENTDRATSYVMTVTPGRFKWERRPT